MNLQETIKSKLDNREYGSTVTIQDTVYRIVKKYKYTDINGNERTEYPTLLNTDTWAVMSEYDLYVMLSKLN